MLSIPDIASVAGAHWLARRSGTPFGPSTGTNIVGTLLIASKMAREGECGAIVTLACDGGDRYAETIYSGDWLKAKGLDLDAWEDLAGALQKFVV
jgi:cysteine synthase A